MQKKLIRKKLNVKFTSSSLRKHVDFIELFEQADRFLFNIIVIA